MALDIEDFKESTLTVDDYEGQPRKGVALNKRTATQLAAGQTILSSGTPEEHSQIEAELLDPENKKNFTLRQEKIRRSLFADAQAGLIDTIANPTLDDETKLKAVSGSSKGFDLTFQPSTLDTLAQESLVADSGAHETARTAEGRNLLLESVNRVNNHKREMTKVINSLGLEQGMAGKVVDIAELMAPFAEWIHYDRLLKDVTGESQTQLLGQQKQQLFDYMKGQPLEERAMLAEQIVEMIQSSDTMVLPDGNDLATLESLENMLVENDYSNFERYFDNVTSVLDVIGVGALARTVFKGKKAAKAASEIDKFGKTLQEEADAFKAQELGTDAQLADEAANFAAGKVSSAPRKAKKEGLVNEITNTDYINIKEEAAAFSSSQTKKRNKWMEENPGQAVPEGFDPPIEKVFTTLDNRRLSSGETFEGLVKVALRDGREDLAQALTDLAQSEYLLEKRITKMQRKEAKENNWSFDEGERLKAEKKAAENVKKAEEAVINPDKTTSLEEEAGQFKPSKEPTVDTVFRESTTEAVRTDVLPTSPSQVIKDYNPELAREMHKMAVDDETGEAAQALYGTTRDEALAKDLLPEPAIKKGSVPNKVEMRRPASEEPKEIRKARTRNGNTIVSEKEMGRIKEKLVGGLEEIEGMVLHPSSMVIRTNPDETIAFSARYSPTDSGFSSPEKAVEAATAAFRNYGMTENNFSILARRGDNWVEVGKKDLEAEITLRAAGAKLPDEATEYAIGMNYDYTFRPSDLDMVAKELDNLTTAPGLISRRIQSLDGLPSQFFARMGQGSIVQNLLDAAAVIHPQILNAASVAVDRTYGLKKLYVEEFEGFTETYSKLDKDRRAMMSDYIHQANLEGLPLSVTDLYARGFNDAEVKALKKWRKANDTMWHAANEDMVQSLRSNGVKVYKHKETDTKLMGRPVSRGAAKPSSMYDATEGTIVTKSTEELDELYDAGGEVIKLTEPMEVDGRWVDQVYTPNTPAGGYTRELYEGEAVLSYRDGYYPVMYDANYFVYKNVKGTDGQTFQKVIAAAKDQGEVKSLMKGIQDSEKLTDEELASAYNFRKDRRLENPSNSLFEEGSWNVSANTGLTSQRLRGERLADAGEGLHNMGKAHLKDPLEAVANQIHQLSQRVSMRNYMDTAKKRWMIQYGKFLDLPVNKVTGQVEIPKNVSELKGKSGAPTKMVADARTNFNYLSGLENGYINSMDSAYRGAMHYIGNKLAEMGLHKLEGMALESSKQSPVQAAKTAAFKLFISGNPARQALIQRGQVLQIGAHNPKYFATNMVPDLLGIDAARFGITNNKKYQALYEEVKDAGVLEAVDAHTLIRDDMLRMADLSAWEKSKTMVGAPLKFLQKVGFDAAEQDVILSAWLSSRDKAIRAGKDITRQRVKDEILGEARAFTLNMNRAGEMPYSQNTLGLVAQFFSFRHKAFLQPFTNRNLSVKQRAELLGYTTVMFGMDATLIKLASDQIMGEEPSEMKDKLNAGLFDTTLNATLTALSGEAQSVDFGDFAPTEAYGMGSLFFSILNTPIPEMMTENPAGSLLFGANPRLSDAFTTGFKYFGVMNDYDDPTLETKITDVVHTALNTFSGYSNIFKARYAYQTGQKMSASGRITDDDVTSVESMMAALGFRTKDEEGARKVAEMKFGDSSYTPDDVEAWYGELKRHMARRYTSVRDEDMSQRVLSEAWSVFGEDRPRVLEQIMTRIEKDAEVGDHKLVMGIIKKMGLETEDDTWKMINALPAGPQRDMATQVMNTRKEMLNGD